MTETTLLLASVVGIYLTHRGLLMPWMRLGSALDAPWGPKAALFGFAGFVLGAVVGSAICHAAAPGSAPADPSSLFCQGVLPASVLVILPLTVRRLWPQASLGWRGDTVVPAVSAAFGIYILFVPTEILLVRMNALIHQWYLRAAGEPLAPQAAAEALRLSEGSPARIVLFASACALAPVAEELLFRGFVYRGLRSGMRPALAIPLSGLLFAIVHEPAAMAPNAALGCFLAFVFDRTRHLAAPITVHALHNAVAFVLVLEGAGIVW